MQDLRRPVTPLTDVIARFAGRRAASVVMLLWGFGEAIVLPIVPDVLLFVLAAAVPRRAAALFGWVLAGAMGGSLVLAALTATNAPAARSIVLAVPGIDAPMLADAERAVAAGDPLSMAHFGPGTPLKVYTVAWWEGPRQGFAFVLGVVANRLERIGPGVLVLAIAGLLAPPWLRRRERWLLAGYVVFWAWFYAVRFSNGG